MPARKLSLFIDEYEDTLIDVDTGQEHIGKAYVVEAKELELPCYRERDVIARFDNQALVCSCAGPCCWTSLVDDGGDFDSLEDRKQYILVRVVEKKNVVTWTNPLSPI